MRSEGDFFDVLPLFLNKLVSKIILSQFFLCLLNLYKNTNSVETSNSVAVEHVYRKTTPRAFLAKKKLNVLVFTASDMKPTESLVGRTQIAHAIPGSLLAPWQPNRRI